MLRNFVSVLCAMGLLFGCSQENDTQSKAPQPWVAVTIHLVLDARVYQDFGRGDPPQLAVWLEDPNTAAVQTIYVTHRAATGSWKGLDHCPVALPYWTQHTRQEERDQSTPEDLDAMTGATPQQYLSETIEIPEGSVRDIYLEINGSGDFSINFPERSQSGNQDVYGNGEPSLVYSGRLRANHKQTCVPILLGRTDQFDPLLPLVKDVNDMVWAPKLVADFIVTCKHTNPE